jgi:hypothetical protein
VAPSPDPGRFVGRTDAERAWRPTTPGRVRTLAAWMPSVDVAGGPAVLVGPPGAAALGAEDDRVVGAGPWLPAETSSDAEGTGA